MSINLFDNQSANKPNQIQSFLDDTANRSDFKDNRNTVIKMLENQEDEGFINDAIINQMQRKPNDINDLSLLKEWQQRFSNLWQSLKERKEKILSVDSSYNEQKEELLLYLEKFIILEKKLLKEKGWKLLEKDEELQKYLFNLETVQKLINNDEIKKQITIS